MNGFFTNGTNGCGCTNYCDLILLMLLLGNCGCNGGFGIGNSCDLVWLILILSCVCGNGCGCK